MLMSRRAFGFTLIETMVALSILLAGIAGSTMLLIRCVQHEREGATRRAAIRLAGSLAEELRALQPPHGTTLPASASAIIAWRDAAISELPDGAEIRVEPADAVPPMYRITIVWPVSGLGLQQFELAVTI